MEVGVLLIPAAAAGARGSSSTRGATLQAEYLFGHIATPPLLFQTGEGSKVMT